MITALWVIAIAQAIMALNVIDRAIGDFRAYLPNSGARLSRQLDKRNRLRG